MRRCFLGAALLTVGVLAVVTADAAVPGRPVAPPPAHPTKADQIQNLDQVKAAIKAYYGDTVTKKIDPVTTDGKATRIHTFSKSGAYAREVGALAQRAREYLARPHKIAGHQAVLFDVDDTSLSTYDYEYYTDFAPRSASNAPFVDNPHYQLRAVPHMVTLERWAAKHGYTVFYLTGRSVTRRAATIEDLHGAGYVFKARRVYTKDPRAPWLKSCVRKGKLTCTTTQYKTRTRGHIESLGYHIVANLGDQYSDLRGGHADKTFKVPNPMYYLP